MTGTTMMALQQPTLAQSNSLLGQRFEETRLEVVRLRRTNEYLRETLITQESVIRLLEQIRECLERRNEDLMEICRCKSFKRPENAHLCEDELDELYAQYYQVKSTNGLPVNLSLSMSLTASNGNLTDKLTNGSSLICKSSRGSTSSSSTTSSSCSSSPITSGKECHKRSPPRVDTSNSAVSTSLSIISQQRQLPSPGSPSLSPSLSSSSAPSLGASSSSKLSTFSSAAALYSISTALAAATGATPASPTPSSLSSPTASLKPSTSLQSTSPTKSPPSVDSRNQFAATSSVERNEMDEKEEENDSDDDDYPQTELTMDLGESEDEMKPMDLADHGSNEKQDNKTDAEDTVSVVCHIKQEMDESDEDEEIEVDDIEEPLKKRKPFSETASTYDDEATNDDNSCDAKSVTDTRLPILKSMLSPVEQTEEKIEINLNPNDFFAGNTNDSSTATEIDLSGKSESGRQTVPSSSTSSENGREVSTSSNGFNVSSSSSSSTSFSSPGENAQPMVPNAAAAAMLANSLHHLPPPPGLPGMPGAVSNLRIALSAKKPNVPSTMLATIAAANGLNINMDAIRPHKCHWPDCKFATKDRKTLRTHMRIHTKEKPFKCSFPNCSYETGDPSNYRKHKRRHIAHTIFACDFEGCNFTTNKPDFMQSHIAIHKGLKPFMCDFENCSSSFYTRSKLEAHRRKHLASGEFPMSLAHVEEKDKPIICTYPNCGKRFINAAGLAGHEVTHLATHNKYGAFLAEHEREKPVVCNFPNCGKRFLNTAGLAGHEVTHRNFISQNMGAIFKNLSFNQLKSLGIFSVANAKQQANSNSNSSASPQQQLQQAAQQMLLAQKNAETHQSKQANGDVIVLDI